MKANKAYQCTDEDAGKRLDFVVSKLLKTSRHQAQKQILEKLVLINASAKKSNYIIKKDDLLQILKDKVKKAKKPAIIIIYEDEDILIINKPAGYSTHPAPGEENITISEIFTDKIDSFVDDRWPGIVHRLDKGTSGVMILSKNAVTQKKLQNDFKNRKIKKTYIALVEGKIDPNEGLIDIPIKREGNKRGKMGVDTIGKAASTRYKAKEFYPKYTLVELKPETGRTHQLRVHLSSIGYPIVGDKKYGRKTQPTTSIKLHASAIEFVHPKTKERLQFVCPITTEFTNFINQIK